MRSTQRHPPSTISRGSPPNRSSAVPGVTSHPADAKTAMRGQAADESRVGGARTSHTYAAALQGAAETRHHTAHNHSFVNTSGARRWYGDNSPQSCTPTSVLREQGHHYYYSWDDSQRYQYYKYTNRHTGRYQRYQNYTNRHNGASSNWSQNGNYEKCKVGCYICDEFNHVQAVCRCDHKLMCGICRRLGQRAACASIMVRRMMAKMF